MKIFLLRRHQEFDKQTLIISTGTENIKTRQKRANVSTVDTTIFIPSAELRSGFERRLFGKT